MNSYICYENCVDIHNLSPTNDILKFFSQRVLFWSILDILQQENPRTYNTNQHKYMRNHCGLSKTKRKLGVSFIYLSIR